MGNQIVTLHVDTAKIKASNVNECCNFGQSAGVSNENFTISAKVGDTLTWQGVSSSSPSDQVRILSIEHEGGENIFSKNALTEDSTHPNTVVGAVLKKTPDGKDYKYKITFSVMNNGVEQPGGVYHIDPKIQVH